ncbi:MAG TPA: hypothetical protein VLH86_04475 [Patescibacteria group bacterium]|nr:hypothetical protein [Patescibacteria group bacterium]
MPENYTVSGTQSSVGAVVGEVQAACQDLPVGELADVAQELQDAAATIYEVAGDGQGSEVAAMISQAGERASAAAGALLVAQENLTAYAGAITGAGGGDAPAVHEAAPTTSSTPSQGLEFGPYAPVIIEERRMGNVQVKAALVRHSPENAALIAGVVRDCDVIVMETAGAANAQERLQLEQLYTTLLSSQVDPAAIQEFFEKNEKSFPFVFLANLVGTDKPVRLIDMDVDDADYRLVEAFSETRRELLKLADDVAPVDELRQAALVAVEAAYHSQVARNERMRRDLAKLEPQLGYAKVGLVMGASHYEVLDGMAPAGKPSSQSIRDRAWAQLNTWDKADAQRAEKGAVDPELLDRMVLSVQIGMHTGKKEEGEHLAHVLTDEGVAFVLRNLDDIAHEPGRNRVEKAFIAKVYLQRIVDTFPLPARGFVMPIDTV